MVAEITISPVVLIEGQWTFPNDPLLSTGKRSVRDKLRRIKIDKTGEDSFTLIIEKREDIEVSVPVKDNLDRIVPGYSEWAQIFQRSIYVGYTKFEEKGFDFHCYLEYINPMQLRLRIQYEQRNVAAAEIGQYFHPISLTKDGNYI